MFNEKQFFETIEQELSPTGHYDGDLWESKRPLIRAFADVVDTLGVGYEPVDMRAISNALNHKRLPPLKGDPAQKTGFFHAERLQIVPGQKPGILAFYHIPEGHQAPAHAHRSGGTRVGEITMGLDGRLVSIASDGWLNVHEPGPTSTPRVSSANHLDIYPQQPEATTGIYFQPVPPDFLPKFSDGELVAAQRALFTYIMRSRVSLLRALGVNMGSEEQMNYTVIGDTINLAARLCSAAQAGQVVVSKIVADALKKEAKLKELELSKDEGSESQEQFTEKREESQKIYQSIKTENEEKIKLRVIQDEDEEHEHFETVQLKIDDKNTKGRILKEETKTEFKEQKKENKFFKYAVVFVVLALAVFFSYSLLNSSNETKNKNAEIKFVVACSIDIDCMQSGKIGTCINPGKKDAQCEFKEEQKINVIVLNDHKECFNCKPDRVLSILESWFGAVNAKEIGYSTDEGKKLAELIGVRLLPAYILENNITNRAAFEQYKNTFVKKNNSYVLSENAAGSTFYFKRDNMPNKLGMFVITGDAATTRAESNLKEFLDNFKDVKFEKHMSTDALAQELGIRNFPTFLVNNKVKFTGIQAAETIKENYCKLNKVDECKKSLAKNLV